MIWLMLVLVFFTTSQSWAACSGSSPNLTAPTWNDVAACHAAATNGDTITVSANSYAVVSSTTITKYVKIFGSGAVTLTDNTPDLSVLLDITESTAGSTQVAGFTFTQGTTGHQHPGAGIYVHAAGGGKPVIIRDNVFNSWNNGNNMILIDSNRGVVARNTVHDVPLSSQCFNQDGFVRQKPNIGNYSTVATFGSADTSGENHLYIEANTLTNVMEAIDNDNDGRMVFRFNTMTNSILAHHGDTSPGARYSEIYKNTWVHDASAQPTCPPGTDINLNGWMRFRAGTGFIVDNTIPPQNTGAWGPKTGIAFVDDKLRRAGGPWFCWTGGYPSPRLTGWGYITGGTTVGGVPQDLQPVYLAGNVGGGNYDNVGVVDWNCNAGESCDYPNVAACEARASAATYIVANREFYQQVASFNGTSGTGYGTRAARPATCTTGVAYWSTDQGSWNTSGSGGQGVLDKCTGPVVGSAGTWTDNWYVPYTYPHPLAAGSCTAGVAALLAFAQGPSDTAAGVSITPAITVAVKDDCGSTVTGSSASIALAIQSGSGTLSGTTPVTASSGVATFSGMSINNAGAYTLVATSTSPTTLTAATSGSFNITGPVVTPMPVPARLTLTQGIASARLDWEYTQGSPLAVGFRIHRNATCFGTPIDTDFVPIASRTYTMTPLPIGGGCVHLTAVDAAGKESGPSNAVSFRVSEETEATDHLYSAIAP